LTDNPLLRDIGVIVLAATVFAALGRAARVPSIVAYIVAGLTIGPVFGLVQVTEMVELIAEVGIALLLFFVGLELSFDKVRDVGRVVVISAVVQMALSAAGAWGLAAAFGFPAPDALVLAAAAAFSSTVVAVKVLAGTGGLRELHGRIAVGVLLIQDLAVVVVLTFAAGLGGRSGVEAAEAAGSLLAAFAGMAVLLATAVLAARRVLPVIFAWIARSQEALLIWSLGWCFVFILAAEAMGLAVEVGAFLAGVSLAQLPLSRELRRRVHPLMNFFMAVFFVTLGIQMELGDALALWPATLALSLFVLIGKPVMVAALVGRQGYGERTAFLAGLTLGQISEFSFVLGALSFSAGVVQESTLSVIGAVGLVTMGASSYMILYGRRLYGWASAAALVRRLGASGGERAESEPPQEGHVIVVGMNALGRRIVRELDARGERTLAIDTDQGKLAGLPGRTMIGNADHLSVLHEAGLERAKLLVSALQIEDANRMLAYRAREAGVPSSVHAFDQSLIPELRQLGATHLMDSRTVGIERVMDALHDAGVYGP
jgi:Kef-type K+ transport system membrane component KefB